MGRASQLSIGRDACFIVRGANGQALAYVYYEQEPGRRAAASALPPPRRFRGADHGKLIAAVRRPPLVINRSLGRILIDTPVADKLLRHPVGAPFGSGRR